MIAIGEVQTGLFFSTKAGFATRVGVTPSFLDVVRNKKPRAFTGAGTNAYLFGRQFREGYEWAGRHRNDVAGTGIVDISHMTKGQAKAIAAHKVWDATAPKRVSQVQREVSSRILFLGTTIGGDVGADVWVHRDARGHVDSLVINNGFFTFI